MIDSHTTSFVSRRWFASAILAALFLALTGCNDKEAQDKVLRRRSNLARVARMYQDYVKVEGSSPSNAIELTSQMRDGDEDDELASEAALEGDVPLVFNADLSDTASVSDHVLAFEAVVPRTGGYVVTADGTVKLMKAGEFANAELVPEMAK